jgi:hypothetical protein
VGHAEFPSDQVVLSSDDAATWEWLVVLLSKSPARCQPDDFTGLTPKQASF